MTGQLDHANITVVSIDRAKSFLRIALPHFQVRGSGTTDHGDWTSSWLHLGTDHLYVSLNEGSRVEKTERKGQDETGINHVGFIVGDVDALLNAYETEGFKCSRTDERPARLRLYVTDHDGITWEFIQYLSEDPAARNDYSI